MSNLNTEMFSKGAMPKPGNGRCKGDLPDLALVCQGVFAVELCFFRNIRLYLIFHFSFLDNLFANLVSLLCVRFNWYGKTFWITSKDVMWQRDLFSS